jgi:hypothetical protein
MQGLLDLTDKTPQEWDTAIAQELGEADIEAHKFRDYDTPSLLGQAHAERPHRKMGFQP